MRLINNVNRIASLRQRFFVGRVSIASVLCVRILLAVAVFSTSHAIAADESIEGLEETAFKQAAALADPCVVRIETVGGLEQVENVLLGNGPTSGVVVSADGFIISSSFNFISKPASILVSLPDGRRFAAKLVASDRLRLLTLLKIDVDGLTPARPFPRDQIKVGQWALALGRTLDNSTPSLSVGIVSAVNRVWGKAIQTDAKTSPVNYGGALIDIEGRVLGVIAPMSPTGAGDMAGVEWYDGGIGFAIPLDDVYDSLDRLKQGTDLLPGLMGITFAGGQSLNVPVIVDYVRYNSPAHQAGLKTNDRIVSADGEKIGKVAHLKQVLGRKYAGDIVKLVVTRSESSLPINVSLVGKLLAYEIPYLGLLPVRNTVSETADVAKADSAAADAISPTSGAAGTSGVVIRHLFAQSPAMKSGLQRGDRITKFNGVNVKDVPSLIDLVGRNRVGDQGTVTYLRDGQESSADVVLGSLPEEIVDDLPTELVVPVTPKEGAEPVKTGRFTATLEGHDHDYWAYVPETYVDWHAFGLIVWIHPGGDTMEASVYKQWKTVCDRRNLILVAPKADKPAGWQPGEAEFIKHLVSHLREKYTIDPARIVVHSHGTGAGMACLFSNKNRDLVRGVVISGAPFSGQAVDNEPEHRVQFLFVCNDNDKSLPKVKLSVQGLRKLKYPVSFRTLKGGGAKYPEDSAIEEIGRWVDSLDRI